MVAPAHVSSDGVCSAVLCGMCSAVMGEVRPYASAIACVTGIVLGIIGILAIFHVGALGPVAPYWYCFELAAFASFVVACCLCPGKTDATSPPQNQKETPPFTQPPVAPSALPQPVVQVTPEMAREHTNQLAYEQARQYEVNKQLAQAYPLYLTAANAGHQKSTFYLARYMLLGVPNVILQNAALAVLYFTPFVEKNNEEAIERLAHYYLTEGNNEQAALGYLTRLPRYASTLASYTKCDEEKRASAKNLLVKMLEVSIRGKITAEQTKFIMTGKVDC